MLICNRSLSCSVAAVPNSHEDLHDEIYDREDHPNKDNDTLAEENVRLTSPNSQRGRKKMFELRLKRNEARKANQTAMVAEKKRMEAPPESKGVSKEKWIEERKKKIGKLLDSNVCNQKTLYNAYKKLSKNIEIDIEEYNKMKEVDPEFYREASSLQYGKAPKVAEDKIKRMVKELKDRDEKQEEKVVHVVKSDSRLANNDLPVDIQRLRCRALYYALRFSPSVDNLGKD
ncbi:hypothetical protein ACSBR2_017528 [Camellia fascicularis]